MSTLHHIPISRKVVLAFGIMGGLRAVQGIHTALGRSLRVARA
jgi:hypothetical protein